MVNINIDNIKSVYFVGAGGIGMSALVRYFLSKGKLVAGYDRTPSELTECLIAEGAQIHYEEDVHLIPEACRDRENTLVVLTPAVPQEHEEPTSVTMVLKFKSGHKCWVQSRIPAKDFV